LRLIMYYVKIQCYSPEDSATSGGKVKVETNNVLCENSVLYS
jgi:hypothetical protein